MSTTPVPPTVPPENDPGTLVPGAPGLERDGEDAGNVASQNRSAVTGISAPLQAFRLDAPFSVGDATPKRSDLLNTVDRFLDQITEKRGRASLTVYEPNGDSRAFTPRYTTTNFLAEQVQINLGESYSISKNNRGFVLYAIDANPITISLSGSLFDGSEDTQVRSRLPTGAIRDTDWFSHFMAAYQYKLRASVAQANGLRIFFSYNALIADVHLVDLKAVKSSMNQAVVGFGLQMVVRTLTIFGPADIAENQGLTRIPDKVAQRFVIGGDPRASEAAPPGATPQQIHAAQDSFSHGTNNGPVASNAPTTVAPVTTFGTATFAQDYNSYLSQLFPVQTTP